MSKWEIASVLFWNVFLTIPLKENRSVSTDRRILHQQVLSSTFWLLPIIIFRKLKVNLCQRTSKNKLGLPPNTTNWYNRFTHDYSHSEDITDRCRRRIEGGAFRGWWRNLMDGTKWLLGICTVCSCCLIITGMECWTMKICKFLTH